MHSAEGQQTELFFRELFCLTAGGTDLLQLKLGKPETLEFIFCASQDPAYCFLYLSPSTEAKKSSMTQLLLRAVSKAVQTIRALPASFQRHHDPSASLAEFKRSGGFFIFSHYHHVERAFPLTGNKQLLKQRSTCTANTNTREG